MVTIGLLSFIVLGLLAMFNQTQRAFRTGMTQSDILEAGRSVMDLWGRELEQMTPSECPDYVINGARYRSTNFFVELQPLSYTTVSGKPALQLLPGSTTVRTNVLQRFFFLSKLNQDWIGTGYEVVPDDPSGLVGTLYRFSVTNFSRTGPMRVAEYFNHAFLTNMVRVAGGVVHLRVRAFANNGYLLQATNTAAGFATNRYAFGLNGTNYFKSAQNTVVVGNFLDPSQAACYCTSNAVPAFVEVELGILESQVAQRFRSIPIPSAQLSFYANHVAQVQIFRQRIGIANVDLSAYP